MDKPRVYVIPLIYIYNIDFWYSNCSYGRKKSRKRWKKVESISNLTTFSLLSLSKMPPFSSSSRFVPYPHTFFQPPPNSLIRVLRSFTTGATLTAPRSSPNCEKPHGRMRNSSLITSSHPSVTILHSRDERYQALRSRTLQVRFSLILERRMRWIIRSTLL